MLIDEIRSARHEIGDLSCLSSEGVVFLGLYNTESYRAKIEKWLPALITGDTPILIVDNSSADDTWLWMQNFLMTLLKQKKVVLARNPVNLGGYGSLATSLDLLSSAKWVMTLHQDDEYLPGHLESHKAAMKSVPDQTGMISSESQSVTANGRKLSYPRGTWLLGKNPSAADIFIAHLKNHCYPFSGASFRIKMLLEIQVPWHSTAFPDTEIVLRALPRWTFHSIEKSTVRYLENPKSESHLLNREQKDFGAFMALVRVFRSAGFSELSQSLASDEVDDFAIAVHNSLAMRLGDAELGKVIQVIAQEAIIEAIGINSKSAELLIPAFDVIGDTQATNNLKTQANFRKNIYDEAQEAFADKAQYISRVNLTRTKDSKYAKVPTVLGQLPRPISRFLYLTLLRVPAIKKLLPQWDFDWRNK